jgi:hypothetical protein
MVPILAGLAMAMSSVTVVGNSILFGRYKPRFTTSGPRRKVFNADDGLKKTYSLHMTTR